MLPFFYFADFFFFFTANVFYDVLEKWSIPGNPNDIELRDEVCSIIFNHCKGIEAYVLHTEKLFRGMLLAQSSYKIGEIG